MEAVGRGELRLSLLAPQRFRGDKPLEGGSAVPALRYSDLLFDGDRQRSDPGFPPCPISGETFNSQILAAAIDGLRAKIAIADLRNFPEAAIAPFESK